MSTSNYHPSSSNLWRILSESKHIIKAHSGHFLALSVLFLLPSSFYSIFFLWQQSQSNPYTWKQIIFFYIISLVLNFLAISTITYSTFLGFKGKPIKLVTSIKRAFYSFLPLLSTFIITYIIIYLIIFFFASVVAFLVGTLALCLGIDIQSNGNYLPPFVFVIGIVMVVILLWIQVNWSLWAVIVVVESKWGYEPLRRSRYLMNGMRGVSLSLRLLYGPATAFFVWGTYIFIQKARHASGWLSWAFALDIILSSAFITIFQLHYFAANVVLYLYCKALHGELDLDMAEEYTSLTFDCEKEVQV